MRSGYQKLCKGFLIASIVAIAAPAAGAGLVVGVVGATNIVSSAVNQPTLSEETQLAAEVPATEGSETAPQPVATRAPTPLSPLVEGATPEQVAAAAPVETTTR